LLICLPDIYFIAYEPRVKLPKNMTAQSWHTIYLELCNPDRRGLCPFELKIGTGCSNPLECSPQLWFSWPFLFSSLVARMGQIDKQMDGW